MTHTDQKENYKKHIEKMKSISEKVKDLVTTIHDYTVENFDKFGYTYKPKNKNLIDHIVMDTKFLKSTNELLHSFANALEIVARINDNQLKVDGHES